MPPSRTVLSSGRLSGAAKLIVDVINVGQGNGILVSYPNGKYMLVDCGSLATSTSGRTFAHAQSYITSVTGGNNIDTVVITHGDTDHTAFIPYLRETQAPSTVFYGGKRSWLDDDVLTWIQAQEGRRGQCNVYHFPTDGYTSTSPDADFGGADSTVDTQVYVLGANYGSSRNDKSVVLMLVYGNQGVVLTGDAEEGAELDIMANVAKPFLAQCILFMPGHHGSFYSTNQKWLDALSPQVASVSASGTNMSYAHPDCYIISMVEKKVLNTAESHRITCADGRGEPYNPFDTTRATFLTATNGDIRYTTDGTNFNVKVSSLAAALTSPIRLEAMAAERESRREGTGA